MAPLIEPTILPGFLELLPKDQIVFNRLIRTISNSYELFGFTPIDTPIIEKTEILLAKGGQETEKQTYTFKKGDNDLSLRFDLTVPFARYVSQRCNDLTFPFKRYQIGKVYRGEKPQKGRFREFYQCDADIVTRDDLPLAYDAEMVSLIYFTLKELNIGDFIIKVSNRKILTGILSEWGMSEKTADILRLIDKLGKITPDEFHAGLGMHNLSEEKILQLNSILSLNGTSAEILVSLESLKISDNTFKKGIEELKDLVEYIKPLNIPDNCWQIDLKIIRGLDYYTGTIYETYLTEIPQIGSVCSGGRYDNLTSYFSNQKYPGVGISIGLTRLFYQLLELEKVNEVEESITKVMVIPMDHGFINSANALATILRKGGVPTNVYIPDVTFRKKLEYANKSKTPYIAILGDYEINNASVTIKNMDNGIQETINVRDILQYFESKLS